MSNITIYCGSSANLAPEFIEAASALGRRIAAAGATLVYGAGRTGLMERPPTQPLPPAEK